MWRKHVSRTAARTRLEGWRDTVTMHFSVIIPAHNEEAVIARCLRGIYEGAPADALPEVIVVANGCYDRTVEVARAAAPEALVLDLPAGSKSAALNTGNRAATLTPRLFLDADIVCDYRALAATAQALLDPQVKAASPALHVDVAPCSALVRAYYRVWIRQPYVTDRLVGSGLYGVSREGLDEIGEFPPIFGDDIWLKTRFSYAERRNVAKDRDGKPICFTVSPPRTLRDLVRVEARRRVGDDEVRHLFPSPQSGRTTSPASLTASLGKGVSIIDLAVYLAVKALAQGLHRWSRLCGRGTIWTRDLSAREA